MTIATRYRAFLSYSRSDERAARRLHRALERFSARSLPPGLRGPERHPLRPVFRDRDELTASGDLSRTLEAALLASEALVVVCSPAAVASHWVNEEIRAWKRAGRDRIFAAVVAGDPALPATCFPPALLEEHDRTGAPTGRHVEPLAVDLRKEPRLGPLRLVAALLDIEFDRLRDRDAVVRRRQRVARSVSVLAVVAATTTVTWWTTRTPPCTDRQALRVSLWAEPQAERIATAFAATAQPYATDAWSFVRARLERYVEEWADAHVDACEATRVRKAQSERLLDLRMECLTEARHRFEAITAQLEAADTQVVERAVQSLELLTPLSRCSDREALEARYPPPSDPALAARVDALFETLATARTALAAGRITTARAAAVRLVNEAQAAGHPPLEAAALLLRADAERDGGAIREARDTYYLAAAKAVVARDPELAATAWLGLPLALAKGDAAFGEALNLARLAESYLPQLEPRHPVVARYHFVVGTVQVLAGAFAEGVAALERAVALARGTDDANLPEYLGALSWGLVAIADHARARSLAAEAVSLTAQRFGSHHPRHAAALVDLSRAEMRLGDTAEAARRLEAAVAIYGELHPRGHLVLVTSLEQLAWLLKENGRYDEARVHAERALALLAGLEQPNWAVAGSIHNVLGDVHLDLGELDTARKEMELALADWSRLGDHPNVAIALNNLGNLANREGRHRDAVAHCSDALRRDEAAYGPDGPPLAYPLSCLGEAQLGVGDVAGARVSLERAWRLRDRPDEDPGRRAWSGWLLGKALWEAGERQRAIEHVTAARAVIVQLEDARAELDEIDAWLADRRRRD